MENGHHKNFKFDEFNLETELQTLRRGGAEIHLAKRPFDVLLFLIENRERVVSRDELLNKFWDGHDVYDDALRKCVGAIRKALDDTEKSPRFIETRRGSGYRFISAVFEEEGEKERKGEGEKKTVGSGSWQLAEKANGNKRTANDEGQRTKDKGRNPQFILKNRPVLVGVLAIVLISLAVIGFFSYRKAQNNAPKTLTQAVAEKRSIAVLPLKNLTGDAANDYLTDGVAESLINELSQIKELRVISRGSAFQFKGKDIDVREIGEKLNTETILEGSLQQIGDKVRVNVRLVSTKDGTILWASDSQERKLADVFAIQNGIVCQLVTELKVKLCGEVAPSERYTNNVKAYQLYLQGLYFRNRLTAEDIQKAIEFFTQALQVDPNYALAHEGLASAYMVMEFNSQVPPGTVAPKALLHAEKALELDDSLAGAYIVLGAVKTMKNYDLQTRENYYNQALLKNPNHRTARLWLANNFTVQGKFEEAEREILRVQEIDPLSFGMRVTLAELYYYWRKPDKSIEQAELMLAANPENKGTYSFLAKAYAQQGEFDKAFAAQENLPPEDMTRALVLASAGRGNEARTIIEAFAKSDEASKNPYWTACLFAAVGERETAFVWLEKSFALRQADLVSIKIDPPLDSLRDDARYLDLLRRVGLAD